MRPGESYRCNGSLRPEKLASLESLSARSNGISAARGKLRTRMNLVLVSVVVTFSTVSSVFSLVCIVTARCIWRRVKIWNEHIARVTSSTHGRQ